MSTDINISTSNVSTSASSMTLTKRYGMIALFAVLALFMGAKLTGALVSAPAGNGASMHGMYTYQTTTLGAPTGVAVTATTSGSSITVTWYNPGTTGAAITSYTVTDQSGTQTLCTQTLVGALGASNSCTWTPTSTTKYSGGIHVQSNGTGVTSAPDTGSASLDVPGAPTITGTVAETAGYMYVAWTAPSTPTLAITAYNVYQNNTLVCTSATSPCAVSIATNGLNVGQGYQFLVTAVNAAGSSVSSALTTSNVARVNPAAVTGLTATYDAAYGTVDLSYTAPASNGGSSLTYTYLPNGVGTGVTCGTAVVVGAQCSIAISNLIGASSPVTFNGSITVVASNTVGTSSATSNVVFVGAVPNAPTSVAISNSTSSFATLGLNTLNVVITKSTTGATPTSFIAQLQTCTSATPGLTVTCTNSGSPKSVAYVSGPTVSTSFYIPLGAVYTVAVQAVNASGVSATTVGLDGSSYEAVAAGAPGIPAVTFVSATNSSITYSFAAPNANGSTISGYSVQLYASGSASGSAATKTAAGTYTISGLAAGYTYDVYVTAISTANGNGTAGHFSGAQTGATPTSTPVVSVGLAPATPSITYTATGATIKWTAPYIDGAGDTPTIASYSVIDNGQVLCTSTTTSCTVTSDALKAQMARLASAGLNFYVVSTDTAGFVSNPSSTITLALPAAVTGVHAYTDLAGDFNITWTNDATVSATGTVSPSYPGTAANSYTVIVYDTTTGTNKTYSAAGTASNLLIPAAEFGLDSYSFAVVANGSTGASATAAASAETSVTATKPAAVGSPTTVISNATGNGHFITVGWAAPATVTGNTLTGYTVTLSSTSATYKCNAAATDTSCQFSGVAVGVAFTATVVANAVLGGTSAADLYAAQSTGLVINNTDVSAAPVITSVTPSTDGKQLTVTWSVPTSSPSPVFGYLVTFNDGAGNAYLVNTDTTNTWNISSPSIHAGALLAPDMFSCGQLAATITSGVGTCTVTLGTSTYGYEYGTKFTITVIAVEQQNGFSIASKVGVGIVSSATSTGTTYAAPAQVSAPVATLSGNNKVTITFAASPATSQAIDVYTITPTHAHAANVGDTVAATTSCAVPAGTVGASAAVDTATGIITETLVAGYTTVYPVTCTYGGTLESITYTVTAHNAAGTSIASAPSVAVIPAATATAPTTVYVAGSTTLGYTVGWAANTNATSFTLTVAGGPTVLTYSGITTNSYVVPASAVSSPNTYTFSVAAVNAAGTGTGSNVNVVQTANVPSAPAFQYYVDSASAPTKITLVMTNTGSNNLPVTYNVFETVNGVPVQIATGVSASYSFPYATGYSAANTSVYAVSAAGSSTAGSVATGYTFAGAIAAPSAPSAATVAAYGTGQTAVTLGWTLGASTLKDTTATNTAPVIAVSASLTSPTGTVISCPTALTASSTSCTFVGLTTNTIYTFSVTNSNIAGASTALVGSLTTAITTPGAPTITSVTAGVTGDTLITADQGTTPVYNVTIAWTAPTSVGGSPITGYQVSVTTGSTTTYCTAVLTDVSTSCTITGLTAGAAYTYSVAALNGGGVGTAATSIASTATAYKAAKSSITLPVAAAGPTAVTSAASLLGSGVSDFSYGGLGTLTVNWTPATDNASAVTSYTCVASATGYPTVYATAGATATSCTFTGLANPASGYTITVKNYNGYQGGSSAIWSAGTTKPWVANSPANFGAASTVGGTISAQWIAPISYPGSQDAVAVTGYTVTATDAAGNVFTCTAASTEKLCTVKGLANKTAYTVVVTPVTVVGNSTVTMSTSVTTLAASAASAVTGLTATRTANGLSVTWTAPTTVGSGQLVGYWVSATDALTGQQYTCPYNATYGVLLAPAVSCNILGLSVGNTYTVAVTAITLDGANNKQLSSAATLSVVYSTLSPKPVIATFMAVTAKQKSVSALSANAKSALNNLISEMNDGASVTVAGYGTTKAIALARANAAANYLFNNGAAVHVTVKTVISKTVKTALVTVTRN